MNNTITTITDKSGRVIDFIVNPLPEQSTTQSKCRAMNTQQNNKIMRIITTKKTVYNFNELSDASKETAIQYLYDINVDYNWWEFVYEDAKNIGLKITGFDLYSRDISGELYELPDTIANNIVREHGKSTDTYRLAKSYLDELRPLQDEFDVLDERYYSYDEEEQLTDEEEAKHRNLEEDIEYLNEEFKKDLLHEYHDLLQTEYDYLTSEEAIIETIEANEYEFTEEGELY